MVKRLGLELIIIASAILLLFGVCTRAAHADHLIYLPVVPNTPLMQQVIRLQSFTYCTDARAAAYPGFVAQLQDEEVHYRDITGILSTYLGSFSTNGEPDIAAAKAAGCQVYNTMPSSFSCGAGAAACIYYGNWPVTVEYNYRLGYIDWRTAIGHEYGHGLLGLHEQYKDSGGSILCTRRTDTVMDCGSSVRYPTALDISRGCAIISTSWCGKPPAPPPAEWCCDTVYPGWEGMGVSRFHTPSGKWFWGIPQLNGSEFLYTFKDSGPWVCESGCPR